MNLVDAVCKACGRAIRWLSGGPMMCQECFDKRIAEITAELTK